jgi:hypothetical protein
VRVRRKRLQNPFMVSDSCDGQVLTILSCSNSFIPVHTIRLQGEEKEKQKQKQKQKQQKHQRRRRGGDFVISEGMENTPLPTEYSMCGVP